MMFRFLAILLSLAFLLQSAIVPAFAAKTDQTAMEKIASVEVQLYGAEQTGSLMERTQKTEKELFGLPGKEALFAKVDRMYAYVQENSVGAPSLILKLNALEWMLTKGTTSTASKAKLENLEKMVAGTIGIGSIDSRTARLMAIVFNKGKIDVSQVTVNKDTLIKIKVMTPLDSKTAKIGDAVDFEATEDVYASGVLVIAKGAGGKGKVSKAEAAQNFGRDAKLEVSFDNIRAIDLTSVPTLLGEKAKQETQSLAKAAGAAFVGLILLGPIGVVGSAFVHGKNITVPVGTLIYIQTQNDVDVFGVTVK